MSNPLLRAGWLTAKRRYQRVPLIAVAMIAAAAGLLVLATSFIASVRADWLLTVLTEYRWAAAALAFVHAVFLTARVRRQQKDQWQRSWLIAAPISISQVSTWLTLRTFAAVLLHLFAMLSSTLLLAIAAGRVHDALSVCALLAIAFIVGSLLGRYLPSKAQNVREDSRYAPKARTTDVVSAQALSRWPIAQALSWQRPENARVALVIALFAVQGGSSMLVGLTVVSAWLLAIYLVTLMQATVHVSRVASRWLKATPIKFMSFAWPLARRVLVHQAIGSVAAAVLAVAMGLAPTTAVYLLALWLALASCVLCVSLADAFCTQQSRTKIALLVLASIGIELRQHGWGMASLLALSAWHVRRATHR
ncbi:MAG: hypothetical protein ACJ8MH_06540 [Povalibacter sp.]